MKLSTNKALVVAAIVFAASMTAAALVYKSHMPDDHDTVETLVGKVTAPTKGVFGFNMLPEPRPLENFRFINGDWKATSLRDFRGKVVLLNIWATWCGPCRVEMPTLDRLQAQLGGPDFEVVALSIDERGVPVVKDFYRELGVKSLRVFVDPTVKAPIHLKVLGVPTTLLIDRDGNEIGRYAGPAEWDSAEFVSVIQQQLAAPTVAKPTS